MADPRTRQQAIDNPKPLDKWGNRDRQILLQMVEGDTVYFGEIVDGRCYFPGGAKMSIGKFREEVQSEGVEYLGGPEDGK